MTLDEVVKFNVSRTKPCLFVLVFQYSVELNGRLNKTAAREISGCGKLYDVVNTVGWLWFCSKNLAFFLDGIAVVSHSVKC